MRYQDFDGIQNFNWAAMRFQNSKDLYFFYFHEIALMFQDFKEKSHGFNEASMRHVNL